MTWIYQLDCPNQQGCSSKEVIMFLDPIKTGPVLCTTALSVFVLHSHALVRWFCCYTALTIALLGLHLLFLFFPQEVLAPATLCPIACLHCHFSRCWCWPQRDFTASCLHGAISPTCAFPPISHLQSRKWELGSIDENERNVFETPQKGPVFVPTIRHHQNEPTDPPIWCWHQHQTKMLVCHLCCREGGQFAWPKN